MRDNFPVMMGIAKGVEDRHCGQIPKIDVLPVTGVWLLRANSKNRRFARNWSLAFTGRFPKIDVLPVTGAWLLRADFKNRRFARNWSLAFYGQISKNGI